MSDSTTTAAGDVNLAARHAEAEAILTTFSYRKPAQTVTARDSVRLCKTDLFRARVVILKKNGGETNLHYHTAADSFWMVLKGRVRFYGPDDRVIGEFGPHEGTSTPRYARYWFENIGEDDLEMLHRQCRSRRGEDGPHQRRAAARGLRGARTGRSLRRASVTSATRA